MEEDEETKRLNERRRIREERRKKQEEDDAKEEQERKAREEERKLRKEARTKERSEREAQQKKELEEYIKRTEEERRQRREEREKRRLEEEKQQKEDEEKRKRQQEERERKRREEDEEKRKRIKELEESRRKVLKELEEDENSSQVDSILSQKKRRLIARQKIESILASVDPNNSQYDQAQPTPNKIISLLLTDELKEEVIDLVASGGFRSLVDYMSQPASISTMAEYLVDINAGATIFASKPEFLNGTASLELKNSLARMQASYEILKGGIQTMARIITDPSNSFILDILFSMISNPPPISLTNMHIFTDLVCSYMSRKPELLIYICNNKDTILPSLMQHLSNSETVDLLLKMAEIEMTQSNETTSSSSSTASSFFSLFTGSSSSSSNSNSSSGNNSNNKEKPNWTNDLTPYLILRINEISNLENVIVDQLDLEIDNIQRLMFELVKKYPKSKVAHHLCGQSFSNAVLRNGFKLALVHPYTSPFSSSMLSLICTLVDSSVTMTQSLIINSSSTSSSSLLSSSSSSSSLSSSSSSSASSLQDLPSVINLLFKQIVIIDDISGGEDNSRELSPIKAISEILTIKKDSSEIFSIVRLKCLHLINSLVKANISKLDREIWESGILKKCIDIFFEYETNNVIHCMIEGILTPLIQRCLGSDDEEFMCHLLKDCSFVSRVVNILSGGNSSELNQINNNINSGNSGNNNNNNGNGNNINGSLSGASKLSALFVNSKDNDVIIVEQQKSEPVIGAPAPAMGSLSRGGGKKIRRKVSFFSTDEDSTSNAQDENNTSSNTNGNGDVKLAIGDLSMFQPPTPASTISTTEQSTDKNSLNDTVVSSEKKFSATLTSTFSISSSSSSSSSTTSSTSSSSTTTTKINGTSSSSNSSSSGSSISKKAEKELKEQEKQKIKELMDTLKSKQLTPDQEKAIKSQIKQLKKEKRQKKEEKKLAKRLKEKEKESKSKSSSSSSSSSLKNSSGSVVLPTSTTNKLKSSSSSSPSSSPILTSTTTSTSATASTPTASTTTTTPTNTTTITSTLSDQSSDTSSNSDSCSNSDVSSEISKLSLNDNSQPIEASVENIESIEEQSVVVVYHNEESSSNGSSSNNTECNNSKIVKDESSSNISTTTTTTTTSTTTTSTTTTKKKGVNHNVGHIISLCIEITHIVNKSKGQLLRDIVDECCLFQGQWDEVVVPKLRQEISFRNIKPIGTVSMRKGRKGGPPTPFANVESFQNMANGVPIPPTNPSSKFFF
ncbi:hypothetical protein ACTFIV_007665 [Dictyostelium citrinum]